MSKWIYNPKTYGSGIITCIPQKGDCPNKCPDCFFRDGRSYLEPLKDNLPHIPSKSLAKGKIVRMNDGNDSNYQRDLVEETAQQYDDYFFNTSSPNDIGRYSGPVVLTVNPGKYTDTEFWTMLDFPQNLMAIRVRTNAWNMEAVVQPAVDYYTSRDIPVFLTFMSYYKGKIPEPFKQCYFEKKHILNSYWMLNEVYVDNIVSEFCENPLVYTCGYKNKHLCKFCGNCIREYYNTKGRMKGGKCR